MIQKLRNQDFDKIYHLMETSFPEDERRTYEEQKALLENPVYQVYVLNDTLSEETRAFIATWEFASIVFIEHFVVNPIYRNSGLGSKMLNELVSHLYKMVCLEVEPPKTEMASRRITFYERNNFFFNEYPYFQPPISKGRNSIPLFIMTSGRTINKEEYDSIKTLLHTQVYKQI